MNTINYTYGKDLENKAQVDSKQNECFIILTCKCYTTVNVFTSIQVCNEQV